MASLRDQLLNAGLIDKKKAQAAQKEQREKMWQQKKGQKSDLDEAKLLAEKALKEKAERSKALNRQQRELAEQQAIQAQIKQLIEMNRINRAQGEITYQFADAQKVKTIRVTPKLQDQLAYGTIGLVRLGTGYELLPKQIIEKIAQRDTACIVVLNINTAPQTDEDDPYANYQIPDDLMW